MLKHASVIISLITATLYALGFTFHQGYLNEFGINDSMFPMSLDQTLFQGFFSLSTMGASAVLRFLLTAEIILVTTLLGEFIINKSKINMGRFKSSKPTEINVVKQCNYSLTDLSYKMFILSVIVFISFLSIITALILSGGFKSEVQLL